MSKIYTLDSLAELLSKKHGHTTVFTNGCFDVLHRGHIEYLKEAKTLGDFLIVAVNSDDSVRRYKGPRRPINTLEDRLEMLAVLTPVDAVVPFEGDTAAELIRILQPNIYVKGGDYDVHTIQTTAEGVAVESYGGKIHIAKNVEGKSTTNLISKVIDTERIG